jgi:hypothetical protein
MNSLLRKYIDIIEAAAPAPAAAPVAPAAPTKAQQLVAKAGLPNPNSSSEQMLANMQKAMPTPQEMMAQQQARMQANKAKTAAATVPGTLKAGDGSAVVDGSGAPVQAGTQPAPAAVAAPAAPAAPEVPAAPAVAATATTAADQDDADMGAAMTANAQAATPAAAPAAPPTQAATPAPAAAPAATPAAAPAAAPNYDTMPFGQAFGAARKAGAKDFMWKGKKYAVQMAPKQAATPKPAPAKPLPGKTPFPGAGQISDNPAAESRNASIMKELNAMRRIAGLKDSGT